MQTSLDVFSSCLQAESVQKSWKWFYSVTLCCTCDSLTNQPALHHLISRRSRMTEATVVFDVLTFIYGCGNCNRCCRGAK